MGNTPQSMVKSVVHAYGAQNTIESQREQQELAKYLKTNKHKLDIDSVVFEGGGAKVAAYVGAAQVSAHLYLGHYIKLYNAIPSKIKVT